MFRPRGKTYCLPCDRTCRDCNGPSRLQCTSCMQHSGLSLETKGVCICNPGYYRFGLDSPCGPCSVGCLRCEVLDMWEECQECNAKEGWARLDNYCSCDSTRGFFASAANPNQCQCQAGFLTNVTNGVTTCQSCSEKFGAGCLDCT